MANAKQAAINGDRNVQRIAGRLARVRRAIIMLKRNAEDASILDVAYRRRCRDKARNLAKEQEQLEAQLKSIRSAINDSIDA